MSKALQEKRSLVRMARALGQEPAPGLLEDIERLEFEEQRRAAREAQIRSRIADDLKEMFQSVGPQSVPEPLIEQTIPVADIDIPDVLIDSPAEVKDVAALVAASISRQLQSEGTLVRPDAEMPAANAELEQKVKYLESWISRIAATGPGSGEVNFRWLDDVNRASINKDWYLTYNPTTKKFEFVDTRVSIEAFDRSSSIAIGLTPALLKPNSFTNNKNMTYNTSTGVFTFLTQCETTLALTVNALASTANQRLFQYAERNTGTGWTVIANSGKTYQLINGQITQVVNAQTISRQAGEQIRYFIYSDSADKVNLITETLPNTTGNTVYVPAIRIQYSGR